MDWDDYAFFGVLAVVLIAAGAVVGGLAGLLGGIGGVAFTYGLLALLIFFQR